MDELVVMEIVCVVSIGKDRFQGEGYFLWSKDVKEQPALSNHIALTVQMECMHLLQPDCKFTFKVSGSVHVLKGPLAAKMRNHLNHVGGGHKPPLAWTENPGVVYGLKRRYPRG